jgi:hypothetical protein
MTTADVTGALHGLAGLKPAESAEVLPIAASLKFVGGSVLFGVDERGAHCALFCFGRPDHGFPMFRTEVLRCEFMPSIRLRMADQTSTHSALVLRCDRASEFADVFGALLAEICRTFEKSTSAEAWSTTAALVTRWADFFREQQELGVEVAVGLWGELKVISAAVDTRRIVHAWRGSEGATYDFFLEGSALEVKVGARRGIHRVSHAQVSPSTTNGVLLSLHALADPQGTSLADLERQILSEMTDIAPYFEAMRRRGVTTSSVRKDAGRWSLVGPVALYRLEDVPRVLQATPGVSELGYKVTLDPSKQLDGPSAGAQAAIFGIELTNLSG